LTVLLVVRSGADSSNHLQFETGDVQQLAALDDLVAELLGLELEGGIELELLGDEDAEDENALELREEEEDAEDAAASGLELGGAIDGAIDREEAWLSEEELEKACDGLIELVAGSKSEEEDRDRFEDDGCEEEVATLGITEMRTDDGEAAMEDSELANELEICEGDDDGEEERADDGADETTEEAVNAPEEPALDGTWLPSDTWLSDGTDED
jgi:hypothetical protein